MSLDTVLKIGKAFRASTNGLKRFKYVKECPKDTDKSSIIRLSLPVNEEFSFDFDNITEITDENIIGSETTDPKLYYLTFKTSDNDSSPKKYLFGDIFYEVIEGKESNYKTSLIDGESSFKNWESYVEKELLTKIKNPKLKEADLTQLKTSALHSFYSNIFVKSFRNGFLESENEIQNILYYGQAVQSIVLKGGCSRKILNDELHLRELTGNFIFTSILNEKKGRSKFEKIYKNETISWEEIKDSKENIDKLLTLYSTKVFLHFDFSKIELNSPWWYNNINAVDDVLNIFCESFSENTINGYVLNKTLYKTLCSGDQKNDKQFPGFDLESKFKSKYFHNEEIRDLFYAIDLSKKAVLYPIDDVKLIVLPYGENLTSEDYDSFFKKMDEQVADRENTKTDFFLSFFDEENEHDSLITQFDLIFSKKGGGVNTPDVDLIELSGIKKSSLQKVRTRIDMIRSEIYEKRKKELKTSRELEPLSIKWSYTNILGATQTDINGKILFKANPKFQSHLIRILPQIYSANYFEDNTLLPSFIQNVEYSIRHKDPKFTFLKYDLEFLLSIQNTNIYKQNFNTIMESKSYELGKNIGKLALFLKPDSKGDSLINSFEKEFAGNLSRHIGQLRDVQKFCSYLFEKYAMHKEKARYIPSEVRKGTVTKNIEDLILPMIKMEIGYDKHECAFGFFASYFAPYEPKTVETLEENLDN